MTPEQLIEHLTSLHGAASQITISSLAVSSAISSMLKNIQNDEPDDMFSDLHKLGIYLTSMMDSINKFGDIGEKFIEDTSYEQ